MSTSYLETQFLSHWLYYYPSIQLEREFKFKSDRKFRFDFAHPATRVAIEIQGARWVKSAHSSGGGIERDCIKFSIAASCNWLVFPFTDSMIGNTTYLNLVAKTIKIRGKL